MNREHLHRQPIVEGPKAPRPALLHIAKEAPAPRPTAPAVPPSAALDDRIAIVGTAGSGKIYTAKGFVERLLDAGARVTIVDPLGVWWGLCAGAEGNAGYPVVVFGGRHADPCGRANHGRNGSPARTSNSLASAGLGRR